MSNFITGMGTTTTQFDSVAPWFTWGLGLLDVAVLTAWLSGMFEPIFLIHAGNFISLIVGLCSAAYVAVKTVDATVSFSEGFAFNYRNYTWLGNMLGAWELLAFAMFMGWSLIVTLASFRFSSYVFDLTHAREMAAKTDGKFGAPATMVESIKFFVLLMVEAFGFWVAAYALGGNVDELVDFFNHHDDDTDKEASTKKDNDPYVTGSALEFDLLYHSVTTIYTFIVYTFIAVVGAMFRMNFAKF